MTSFLSSLLVNHFVPHSYFYQLRWFELVSEGPSHYIEYSGPEIITPERAVDKSATEKLATAMTDIITSGVLDELAKEETAFHELSMSRLGSYGDEGLYNMIFDELRMRGLFGVPTVTEQNRTLRAAVGTA